MFQHVWVVMCAHKEVTYATRELWSGVKQATQRLVRSVKLACWDGGLLWKLKVKSSLKCFHGYVPLQPGINKGFNDSIVPGARRISMTQVSEEAALGHVTVCECECEAAAGGRGTEDIPAPAQHRRNGPSVSAA